MWPLGTESGLFYFDASYRPVPLAMQFIWATDKNIMASKSVMDQVCFQKVSYLPVVHHQLMNCERGRLFLGILRSWTASPAATQPCIGADYPSFPGKSSLCGKQPQYERVVWGGVIAAA